MYLCGVLYGYDFKSHDQYGNSSILNCDREGRDLSSELPQFYVNVDFGFLPLTRELKKKNLHCRAVLPRIHLFESPEKSFVVEKQIVTFPFLFEENCDMNNRKSNVEGQMLVVEMK